MLADILFTILMLILSAILWIVPKTRRNNGNWLIAWKTVPLGIIALYWSDELLGKIAWDISERQERDISRTDCMPHRFRTWISIPGQDRCGKTTES